MTEQTGKRGTQRGFPALFAALVVALLSLFRGEPGSPPWTLALVGDVMLGRGVAEGLSGDWKAAFAQVQPWLAEADLSFANLESPLTTAPQVSTGYDLRAPLEAVSALRAAGFDVVSLANNHALDAGEAGLQEMVATLRGADIVPLTKWKIDASADWPPAYQPTTLPTVNPPVYFLAFDDSVAPLDVEAAAKAVAIAAERAKAVIVSIHWGGEYQAAPGPRQRVIAQALATAGADIIIGHGPHVLQRIEWVGETLVAYSLGNFLFDQPYPLDCRQGAILRITVQGTHVIAVETIPTVTERGYVKPAGPEDAAAILARLALGAASR